MSDDELERRLSALRPADLPTPLRNRLWAAEPRAKIVRWLAPTSILAAAAAWTIIVSFDAPKTNPIRELETSDLHVFMPVAQESTLLSVEELGVIEPLPDQTVRLVRATWLDDVTYRGDDGHSTFQRRESRAEIVPIVLQQL